jgi:hypothetical protein
MRLPIRDCRLEAWAEGQKETCLEATLPVIAQSCLIWSPVKLTQSDNILHLRVRLPSRDCRLGTCVENRKQTMEPRERS